MPKETQNKEAANALEKGNNNKRERKKTKKNKVRKRGRRTGQRRR